MAIHYDPKTKRFRDDKGRLVARDRAMRSSIARREYEKAQKAKPKPKPKTPPPPPPKKRKAKPAPPPPKKRKAKPAPPPPPPPPPPPKVSRAKPKPKPKPKPKEEGPRIPPWEREGIVKEYPDPDEWFPEIDFYGYDDLEDDWGDYDDEDTDS